MQWWTGVVGAGEGISIFHRITIMRHGVGNGVSHMARIQEDERERTRARAVRPYTTPPDTIAIIYNPPSHISFHLLGTIHPTMSAC